MANFSHCIRGQESRPYYSIIRFSMRQAAGGYFSSDGFASGPATTGWQIRLDPSMRFMDAARFYQDQYLKCASGEFLASHVSYVGILCAVLKSPPTPLEPPSDVDMSSLGLAERYVGRQYGTGGHGIDVNSIRFGVDLQNQQGCCFVWTFRDRLTINLCWNEAYHVEDQMNGFLQTLRRIVLDELCSSNIILGVPPVLKSF